MLTFVPRDTSLRSRFEDKYDKLDCGGGGDCGYLCLAAGLGFQRGQRFDGMRAEFPARAATIRNDIYKHVTNVMHEESYKTFFEPESLSANEEQEAGPIPKSWEEWAQTTFRPCRWIDGFSTFWELLRDSGDAS